LGRLVGVNAMQGVARGVPCDEGAMVAAVPLPPARECLEASKNKCTPCGVTEYIKAGGADGL
jgi:hypothetical protein